jgi:capsular polysaccharide biosynthesis protein/cellulose biosynthesis protein BcsQ
MTLSTRAPDSQPAARRQLEFLKRQLGIIALVTALTVSTAAAVSFTQPKVYRASTKIVVGQGGSLQPQFGNVVQPFTQTMSSLLLSDIVATRVIRNLGLNGSSSDLLENIHVSSAPDSAVLQVSFDSRNRAEAVRILDSLASVFIARVKETLGGPAASKGEAAVPVITATVFDPAHAFPDPISPHPTRTLAFAGIIGLALGIVLGLLRDTLDERMRGRDEVEEYFGAPVVAVLPKNMLGRRAMARGRRPVASFVQAVEPLRLQLSRGDAHTRVIVITSGGLGEGKSTVAANLSIALALSGEHVICVDADPAIRRLSHYFDLQDGDGDIAEIVRGPIDLPKALREVDLGDGVARGSGAEAAVAADGDTQEADAAQDLAWIAGHAGGSGKPGQMQLLVMGHGPDSDQETPYWSSADLVADLKSRAEYVVVDAPPLPSRTTFELLSVAEKAIIVAQEKTTKERAKFVRETLERLEVPSYVIVTVGATARAIGA